MNAEPLTVLNEIQSALQSIRQDAAIYEGLNFTKRAEAVDFIDFHIIGRIEGLGQSEKTDTLKQQAEKLKQGLEEIDTCLFKQLRENIRDGIYTHPGFREMVCACMGYDVSDMDEPDKVGYDDLDLFINGLLSANAIPEATIAREHEMVFYQKTPARIIFQMAKQAQLEPGDVFFDLGSGLGQVAILLNLVSNAVTKGVEYEPAYCSYAQQCALQLNLANVEFINADARNVDYAEGTVFFMYTPFEGSILQDMLEILQQEAQKRPIRIFTYGPCSPQVARQTWLGCINDHTGNPYKLYEFISLA